MNEPIPRKKMTWPLNLRAGDWVEVRSAEEILATLDRTQALDGLPFMPEMLQYCGRKFRVYKSAHKTCDTVRDYVIRRMDDTVHLEELRCDGSGHAGCQAGCLLYWKEAWLKRTSPAVAVSADASLPLNRIDERYWSTLLQAARVPPAEDDRTERFRCQATDLLLATHPVRRRERWDPRPYLKDLTSGNVPLFDFIRYGMFAALNSFVGQWWNIRLPHLRGMLAKQTPTASLNLQPGEFVQVRSRDEILKTLDTNKKNRGLFFDVEMAPHCGRGPYRVRSRVERIVDEKTGRLIELPNPCLILEGVTCSGMLSSGRMFCPRHLYPFWREIWLRRVEEPQTAPGRTARS
jgi:hypothetical protein